MRTTCGNAAAFHAGIFFLVGLRREAGGSTTKEAVALGFAALLVNGRRVGEMARRHSGFVTITATPASYFA